MISPADPRAIAAIAAATPDGCDTEGAAALQAMCAAAPADVSDTRLRVLAEHYVAAALERAGRFVTLKGDESPFEVAERIRRENERLPGRQLSRAVPTRSPVNSNYSRILRGWK